MLFLAQRLLRRFDDPPQVCELVVFLQCPVTDREVPLFAKQLSQQLAVVPALVGGFDALQLVYPLNRRRESSAIRLPSSTDELRRRRRSRMHMRASSSPVKRLLLIPRSRQFRT